MSYSKLAKNLTTSWSHSLIHAEWDSNYNGLNNNKLFSFDNPTNPTTWENTAVAGQFFAVDASYLVRLQQVGNLPVGTLAPVRDYDYHLYPQGEKFYYICSRIKVSVFNKGETSIRGRFCFLRAKNTRRNMGNDIDKYLLDYPYGCIDSFNKNDFTYWGIKFFKFDNLTTTTGQRDFYFTINHRKYCKTNTGAKATGAGNYDVDMSQMKCFFAVQVHDPTPADANIVKFAMTVKNYWIEGYNG